MQMWILFHGKSVITAGHYIHGRFHAIGTPMAKDLRLHFSAQCALREITILHNFAIKKVEKNISLQRFRDLKTLF
jgi:hypothetical protein